MWHWVRLFFSHIRCAYRGHAFIPAYRITIIRRNRQNRRKHVYTCQCCGYKEAVRPKDDKAFHEAFKPSWDNLRYSLQKVLEEGPV